MTAYALRSGASGPRFTGNPGDVLTLDASGEHWLAQPGATAGLTAFNHRTAPDVVPTAGDYDISQIGGALATNGQIPVWNSGLGEWVPTTAAPGGVTSWNTRTGAVTFQNGDAAASQITNDSSVTGSTVKLALQALAAVTAALAIATTAPLAGGGVVQSGLTLSVASVSNTSSGVVPQVGAANTILASTGTASSWVTPLNSPVNPSDNGKVAQALNGNFSYLGGASTGQALIWNNTTPGWAPGTDFGAQNLTTTGTIAAQTAFIVGATPSLTGQVRVAQGTQFKGRNAANALDVLFMDFGSTNADNLTLTSATVFLNGATTVLITNVGGGSYQFGSGTMLVSNTNSLLQFSSASPIISGTNFASLGTATDITLRAPSATNAGAGIGGGVVLAVGTGNGGAGNVSLGVVSPGNAGMARGVYVPDRGAAPTGNPTTGLFHWSETGGLPSWRTVAGNVFTFTGVSTSSASVGGASALPALPQGYFGAVVNGTAVKIAYWLP